MKKPLKKYKKIVIGLTGGIGTGKTTVASMMAGYGATVIDADAIGHGLLTKNTAVYRAIVKHFGRRVLAPDGSIDRRALSAIVFGNQARLRELDKIIHPRILRMIKKEIAQVRKGVVVVDAPLLIETGFHRYVDKVAVVISSRARQVERMQKKSGLSKAAVDRRIRSQMPLSKKVRMADFVIDNNGTRKDLRTIVTEIRRMWWTS